MGYGRMPRAFSSKYFGLYLVCFAAACTPDTSVAAGRLRLASHASALNPTAPGVSSKASPRRVEPRKEQSLNKIDDLSVDELQNFLAGKKLEPGGLVPGYDILRSDGTWQALAMAAAMSFQEGIWNVRPGSDGKPQLCTTEIKRNYIKLTEKKTICRSISVSLKENKAALSDSWVPYLTYVATISPIDQ